MSLLKANLPAVGCENLTLPSGAMTLTVCLTELPNKPCLNPAGREMKELLLGHENGPPRTKPPPGCGTQRTTLRLTALLCPSEILTWLRQRDAPQPPRHGIFSRETTR
jgi:hypothetical protein